MAQRTLTCPSFHNTLRSSIPQVEGKLGKGFWSTQATKMAKSVVTNSKVAIWEAFCLGLGRFSAALPKYYSF
jgi:hypothetical protein